MLEADETYGLRLTKNISGRIKNIVYKVNI